MIPGPIHITTIPDKPEEFHKQSEGLLPKLLLHDAQRFANPHSLVNRVVFDCIDPSPHHKSADGKIVNGPDEKGKVTLRPYYIPVDSNDTTLVFESRFESGNLRRAIQVYRCFEFVWHSSSYEFEYDLILKWDVNTRGHTQWFYFQVQNMRKGVKYKFNIINLVKPDSLYNTGMKILGYSTKDAETKGFISLVIV
jgi:hypothetical protein